MNKYLYILDFTKSYCEIYNIFDHNPEEWLCNHGYSLDNIQWMVSEEFNLIINV